MAVPSTEIISDVSEKQKTIRVVIVDDHPIFRYGLKKLLAHEQDIEVVGEGGNGREALDRVQECQPDVLLLDLRMPNMDGLSVLKALQQSSSSMKVIVMTASEDKKEFVAAMRLGCSGIVLKQAAWTTIVKSIRKVHAGEIWLDSLTTSAVMAQFAGATASGLIGQNNIQGRSLLSPREREIAGLVARGYKNKDVGAELFITEQTVKNHLHNIFAQLGISDRLELALYVIHQGLQLGEEGKQNS